MALIPNGVWSVLQHLEEAQREKMVRTQNGNENGHKLFLVFRLVARRCFVLSSDCICWILFEYKRGNIKRKHTSHDKTIQEFNNNNKKEELLPERI